MNHRPSSLLPHTRSAETVRTELSSAADFGLTAQEAQQRLTKYGQNRLAASSRPGILSLLTRQLKNALILILFVGIGLSAFLDHTVEAIAIGIIVFFSIALGFIQEWRAERALEALQELTTPHALVLRDGIEQEISTYELVPGDIIILGTGDRIPADARLLEAVNLKIEEAPLTGESVAVEKDSTMVCAEKTPIGDRRNMVFAGTSVTYGRGQAIVTSTGMATEFGHIASLLKSVEREETPLQKNLNHIGHILTAGALVIVVIIVALGVLRGQPLLEALVFAIALAVAVVPEALPAVVTIALAIGVQRMSKRNALVRYLPAVETLGSTTFICSDKTGTLTKDEMTVRKIFLADGTILEVTGSGYEPQGAFLQDGNTYTPTTLLQDPLRAATLSSDAHLALTDGVWGLRGDPTEAALIVAAAKAGLHKEQLDDQFLRTAEIPFSSETKRMTTLHQTPQGTVAYAKGAAEVILAACTQIQTEEGIKPLDKEQREIVSQTIRGFAKEALRVIGVAHKPTSNLTNAEQDMIFLGLFGMIDPPREEAKTAIATCKAAGIRLMMITGDHAETAEAIARELDLLIPGGKVITGQELARLSLEELEREVETISVCARVSPEHKLRVIEALQRRGHVVAMTGDGVNDAPALKRADIGIAMGITGTDVTKEAAAVTLADDNFASIVAAVEEGRIIFANIKKFLVYLLSSNLGEIGLIAAASLFGLPLPLTAVQILYLNLASDGLPALSLAVDPGERDIMHRPPRSRSVGLFSRSLWALMIAGGLWVTIAHMGLYVWATQSGRSLATVQTMVFVSIVCMQLITTYCFRSDRHSVFHRPWSNRWLNRAVLWEAILLLLVVYVPFLQTPLNTTSLSGINWIISLGTALTIIPILEGAKKIFRQSKTAHN